jgi:hypothetical protein
MFWDIKVAVGTSQNQWRITPKSGGLSASIGCGSEHIACEPKLQFSLTARGTAKKAGGQFRMGIRSDLSFANLEDLSIRKFLLMSRGLGLSAIKIFSCTVSTNMPYRPIVR